MQIFNSYIIVGFLTFGLIVFPLFKNILKGTKITSTVITYNIIHTMLLLPIPNLLLIKRQLISIGDQSVDDMLNQFDTGLDRNLVLINQFNYIYLFLLCIVLIHTSQKLNKHQIHNNIWFFLIMLLNTGIVFFEFNPTKLIFLCVFSILLLFGKFSAKMIKPIYTLLMTIYFYLSFIFILIKPDATIFNDGTWSGIFTNPNGIVVVSGFTLILILLSNSFNWRKKTLLNYTHISFLLFMVIMSGSRNALLVSFSILFLYITLKFKLKIFVRLIIITGFVLSFLFISYFKSINLVEITSVRWLIWVDAFDSLKDNFIFGNGSDYYSLDNRLKNLPNELLFASSSYSSFIDYIVFYGLIGGILISGFTISLYKKLRSINIYYLSFFILFIIPNLFESYFKPPNLDLNNVIYLIVIFIVYAKSIDVERLRKYYKITNAYNSNENSRITNLSQS